MKVFFPKFFLETYEKKRMKTFFTLISGARIEMKEIRSNPSKYVMMFRPNMADSDFGGTLPNAARCLYSRWSGYLEQPEWKTTKANLESLGGDLIEVHTSGHIYAHDIIDFVKAVTPGKVVPVHTFAPQAFQNYFDNVLLLADGHSIEV